MIPTPYVPDATRSDPTKSRWYIATDLAIKFISSVLLASIAIIGTHVQRTLDTEQQDRRLREERERRFIPVLQTLSEVQLLAAESSRRMLYREPTPSERAAEGAATLGTQLIYASQTLEIFDFADDIALQLPAALGPDSTRRRHFIVPLEIACLCFGDTLRFVPHIRSLRATFVDPVRIRIANDELIILDSASVEIGRRTIHPRCARYWAEWLGPGDVFIHQLYGDGNFADVADGIGVAASAASRQILRKHPLLAERYAAVRSDVLKARDQLVPQWPRGMRDSAE